MDAQGIELPKIKESNTINDEVPELPKGVSFNTINQGTPTNQNTNQQLPEADDVVKPVVIDTTDKS